MAAEISVYGTDWCGDTQRILHHLNELGMHYHYINIDKDQFAERKVIDWNGGKRITPTVVISSAAGTNRLFEPEDAGIDCVLAHHELQSAA